MRLALVVFLVGVGAVGPAMAQSSGRPLVFVADVAAPSGLQADAASLTTALCGVLAKDVRVEVLCAPDVKQIMGFAAMGALTGGSSPAVDALERRLAAVTVVVSGTLAQKDTDTFTFVVAAGPRAADGGAQTPAFETPTVRLEETAKGKSGRLLERLPELSARLLKPFVTRPSTSTSAPPEPLK
jgi:hypothetical protein